MSDINLSKAVRSNLLSLQNTASLMGKTQERLATGNKVNSALDNPTNFFTASSLNSRAGDMSALLDGMANGIQTLQAADNGLKAITKNLESMQSTLRQARQDKSFQTESYTVDTTAAGDISFTGGSVGATAVDVAFAADATVDEMVTSINGTAALSGKVRASNDNGKLRIENISTQDLTVAGAGITGPSATIEGNSVRADLATQYNELRDQLDKLADDASFNGVNLLRGDLLKITFNETGTSELEIQSRIDGVTGASVNSATLGLETNMEAQDFDADATIDAFLTDVKSAINTVRSQSSAFGSSLSIVENRQDFSKNMINTLQTGAANLTLADANEEAANLLALQTRQQLSSTALSMASQSDQAVLRLF
jgi:flagellin-like hook-associated protein FlgL